jgi:hypothetical protein
MRNRETQWIACLALALACSVALACSRTRIVEQWTSPGLEPTDLRFEHVVAVAVVPSETQQRVAEDALVARASRVEITPAYRILAPADRGNVERAREVLTDLGVDGAIVVQLLGVDQEQTYVAGTMVPGGFYGLYGGSWASVYQPGYVVTDTVVRIETSLYDVEQGRLLWTAVSETMNPSTVEGLIEEIVAAARKELAEQGLLP